MNAKTFLLALLIVVCATACGSAGMKSRVSSLDDTMRQYSKLVRWAEYEAAAKHIVFRDREPEVLDNAALRDIRVTKYSEIDRTINEEATEATIRVRIEFYDEDSAVIRTISDTQTWWYDEESKRWFLDDELPDFSQALRRKR